ncbi:MAG: hypothetical protein QOK21_948 [Solirubrobacteraceae bacterium]|jgi:uncharacterized membrane protein|nr:hypothetical protein [Solirubrobacteraceae bacterium]
MRDRHLAQDVADLGRADPLWPGQLATLVALALYLALPVQLTIGPNWPVPAAELGLLAALVGATRAGRTAGRRRELAMGLVLVAVVANLTALGMLSRYLLAGGHASGSKLIGGGVLIWLTNWLLFAVLYWELDRGGPVRPAGATRPVAPDLLFPAMTEPRLAPHGWKPSFVDYLYVSLTNQTAFSPTDTMPLTTRVKLLMAVQGVAGLVTTGVIVAHAVNILG